MLTSGMRQSRTLYGVSDISQVMAACRSELICALPWQQRRVAALRPALRLDEDLPILTLDLCLIQHVQL